MNRFEELLTNIESLKNYVKETNFLPSSIPRFNRNLNSTEFMEIFKIYVRDGNLERNIVLGPEFETRYSNVLEEFLNYNIKHDDIAEWIQNRIDNNLELHLPKSVDFRNYWYDDVNSSKNLKYVLRTQGVRVIEF